MCSNSGLFRYRDKVFPCRRQSCIWLERQDSRGDSHHSAIEPASATMHDEMKVQRYFWRGVRFLAAAVVIFVAAYTACIGVTWYQYGRVRQPPHADSTDALLDSFIPAFDVARRQQVRVAAPTETTFSAACEMYLQTKILAIASSSGSGRVTPTSTSTFAMRCSVP